jgi:uncharacterized protein YbjT (DUF2867 family)
MKILVTGATGNTGAELLKALERREVRVKAGVRNPDTEGKPAAESVEWTALDFEQPLTFSEALREVDKVFLLRPPAISDVKKYLFPFVDACVKAGVKQLVFLSLAEVENRTYVPHYKVEQYIRQSGLPYTFLRPAFFMQNLSTTHVEEIKKDRVLFLPAGKGKTAFVDVRDVAEAAAIVLTEAGHLNTAYELTGTQALDYYEIADMLSRELGKTITYKNPSPLRFFVHEWRKGRPVVFTIVMIGLYALTKYGKADQLSDDLRRLLGREPISFARFVKDYRQCWL